MIDESLIKKCEWELDTFDVMSILNQSALLANYKSLIEQNAELQKELAKLKGDRVFLANLGTGAQAMRPIID